MSERYIVLSERAADQNDRVRDTREEATLLAGLLASTNGRRYFVARVVEEIPLGQTNTTYQIVGPVGFCDGSGEYAYDPHDESGNGRGKRLPHRCPGCRACF